MRRAVGSFPRGVWLFALALALLTSLPYIVGQLSAPTGWEYSGALVVPSGTQVDYNSHMAKMWQGRRGEWDYHLLFTHEPHSGIVGLQGFYVALGAFSPFDLTATYHFARFLLTIGMVLAIWAFACRYFERSSERWLCLLFGTVVSGWSLILSAVPNLEISPIEFWLTDAFNLFGAFTMPHFAAAIILQIVIMLTFDSWAREGGSRRLVILTLALAADAVVQPYAAVLFGPLLVILAGHHVRVAKRLELRRALWLALPLGVYVALVVYQYAATQSDPVWASFSQQNQTLSPPFLYYALGFLPLLLPIILGARTFLLDQSDDKWLLPLLWAFLVGMLIFAPLPTQRRYLLGVQTPLAILAVYGWSKVVMPRLLPRRRPLLTMVYLTLAAVGHLSVISINAVSLSEPYDHPAAFYSPDERQGYAWLKREAAPDDLVLTVFNGDGGGSGGRLVAATGQHVFAGHWFETADFENKMAELRQFYHPSTDDQWRRDFLRDIGAVYVWYDDYTRGFGDWNPADADYLELALAADSVTIYRVVMSND
ncbi:MAG: hypothetical protein H7175_00910 [Burkholderiales bacterium]|nr:hypothetical protein [Anaerolineae bacterium]